MVKTKPNQKIHVDKLKTTGDKLGQLKEKPKEELTLRESIYFLRDKLHSALKKGYSYQDLSEILEEQDILISASTLKQYLTEIGKESSNRRKRKKSAKSKNGNLSNKTNHTLSQAELNENNKEVKFNNTEGEIAAHSKDDSTDSDQPSAMSIVGGETVKGTLEVRKSTKNRAKVLSKNNRDLSEDFNQY